MVHAPALELSKKLLSDGPDKGSGSRVFFSDNGSGSRVFFSDNGSTAMEVCIKMGLNAYQKWHSVTNEYENEWIIAAQEDSYHGDT
jgi:adenosylmethionine-8-amino-7-oxononanoate aminotransferase